MDPSRILIIDNAVVSEALRLCWSKDSQSHPSFHVSFASAEACANSILSTPPGLLVVNADYSFSTSPNSPDGGLRLIELLRMDRDFGVPILVYSWHSPQSLRLGTTSDSDRWSVLTDSFTLLDDPDTTQTKQCDIGFKRLPCSASELYAGAQVLASQAGQDSQRARLKLARDLLEAEMERLCRAIRHRYRSVMAAQRLLLGAFLAGDVSFANLSDTVQNFGNKDAGSLNRLSVLRHKWMAVETELVEVSLSQETQAAAAVVPPVRGSVLIVDDHYDANIEFAGADDAIGDLGWGYAYESLFRSRRFEFEIKSVSSYDKATKLLDFSSFADIELIVLDVDLGDPDKSGLHLLQEIRARDPFVPILVMTSFDDAEVCQMALELQADAFFAKQLRDEGDRTSVGYYHKFVETVSSLLESSRDDRQLYRDFVQRLPVIIQMDKNGKKDPEDGVLGEMTKFFVLLRVAERYHLARHLLLKHPSKPRADSFDELMLILLDAIIAWRGWYVGPDVHQLKRWFVLPERVSATGIKPKSEVENFVKEVRGWQGLRHSKNQGVSLAAVRALVKNFLTMIPEANATQLELRPAVNQSIGGYELGELIVRARERELSAIREHSIRSKMGSAAVLLGGYLSSPAVIDKTQLGDIVREYWDYGVQREWNAPILFELLEEQSEKALLHLPIRSPLTRPLSLLIIDDHATSNGWAYASQLILNNASVTNLEFDGVPPNVTFEEDVRNRVLGQIANFDVVLLDLRMPAILGSQATINTGLEMAEIIKRAAPLIPVIILSAHNEARTMRRALHHGANEFFPREAPVGRDISLITDYSSHFGSLPQRLGFVSEEWVEFNRICRRTLYELTNLANKLNAPSGFTDRPDFLTSVLCYKIQNTKLRKLLGLNSNQLDDIHAAVINQVTALFRRALFFLSLHRERYLSSWLHYFTSAIPDVRLNKLGYDQVWIDCGMIVEFIFNVVAVGRAHADRFMSPGDRQLSENQALINNIEASTYALGKKIWDARNDRRYGKTQSTDTEENQARHLIEQCIEFMSSIKLLPTQINTAIDTTKLDQLRENLLKSQERLHIDAELKKLSNSEPRGKMTSGEAQAANVLFMKREGLEKKLKAVEPQSVLEERRALLSHLLLPPG